MDPERVKTNATVFDPLQGRESNRSIRGRRPDESDSPTAIHLDPFRMKTMRWNLFNTPVPQA